MPLLYDQKNLKPMSQREMDEAVKKHNMFISARVGGARALLTYRNLSNLSMRGVKLTGADFTGSMMFGCDARGANLDGSVFFSANMQKADFSNASFVRGDFRGCNLKGANFTGADLSSGDFREGSIARKDRSGNINLVLQPGAAHEETKKPQMGYFTEFVDASEGVFTNAKMVRAMMRGANFTNAVLEGADLSMAQMPGAIMKGAVLRGARFESVDLADVDMQGVLLDELQGLSMEDDGIPFEMVIQEHNRWLNSEGKSGRQLDLTRYDIRADGPGGGDFSGHNLVMMKAMHAILYHVRFSGAQMEAAELRDNDLRLADFSQVDARGIDFSGSNMMRANLQSALLGPLKLSDGRYLKTNFSRCNLRYTDFTGADLRQVNFTGADLTAADLRGADMDGVTLDHCITDGVLMGA